MMKMVIFNLVLQTEDCLFSGCFFILCSNAHRIPCCISALEHA